MLTVEGLCKSFGTKSVLSDVNFTVDIGEVVGLVGGSGSGKTTIARCVLGLERPSAGRIGWRGETIQAVTAPRAWRKDIQTVFQDPRGSLDPRWTIHRSLLEPIRNWFPQQTAGESQNYAAALMAQVGLGLQYLHRYPHELSTGQCQRACIARALAPDPRLLILDEPLSALDVTVQAQVLRLLEEIRAARGVGYLFISHDVAVVAELSQRILVLERGRIVEEISSGDLFTRARHPCTRALVADAPVSWDIRCGSL